MRIETAISAVARLAPLEGRQEATQRLADAVGAKALLLLVHNREVGSFLPAEGSARTLPGGAAWREMLRRCGAPGLHRGQVPDLQAGAMVAAAACSDGRAALVFLDGEVRNADLDALRSTLPLLAAVLGEQQAVRICRGELNAAQFEMRQYASLARALDEARGQVERTLREMGVQAQRLDEARDRAEQATRAKDHFLAMLGHELRNPLAPIVTVLQLLHRRGQWSPEHAVMQRQVEHLQRLVDDLLDVSRIAGGKLVMSRRVIELVDVVRRAYETSHSLIANKQQQLDIDVPVSGLAVDGDPARLTQVFSNLITNASKYSDPGARIALRACVVDAEVEVEVVDEGIGIPAAMLDRVFDLFEQEAGGIDRAQGGLGLGLAIVRNLVQQHGGRVYAESAGLGRGSRFVVRLPLANGKPQSATAAKAVATERKVRGGRILLVDDNADALTTLSAAMRFVGYTVEIAVDGASALEAARVFRPDLAVLDIGLPGMDGYALATALRAAFPSEPPKLVALTGYGQPSEKERAADVGFDAHLVKPVDFPELQRVIETLLAPRKARLHPPTHPT